MQGFAAFCPPPGRALVSVVEEVSGAFLAIASPGPQMLFHRPRADVQLGRDLPVAAALRRQLQDPVDRAVKTLIWFRLSMAFRCRSHSWLQS